MSNSGVQYLLTSFIHICQWSPSSSSTSTTNSATKIDLTETYIVKNQAKIKNFLFPRTRSGLQWFLGLVWLTSTELSVLGYLQLSGISLTSPTSLTGEADVKRDCVHWLNSTNNNSANSTNKMWHESNILCIKKNIVIYRFNTIRKIIKQRTL